MSHSAVSGSQFSRESSRRSARAVRFSLAAPIEVLSRPFGMRFYTFPMAAVNASQTGFLLVSKTSGFIPYGIGSQIHATIDMHTKIFSRPIHMVLKIERLENRNGCQGFGCSIVEIMDGHGVIFHQGLAALGNKDAIQT